LRLLLLHCLDDHARSGIAACEPLDVALQVFFDLALGLREKAAVAPAARAPCPKPQRERARVPNRVQQAQPTAEFAHPVGAPCQVIALLARRLAQGLLDRRALRRESLPLL